MVNAIQMAVEVPSHIVVIQTVPQFCFVILFASFLWGWGASLYIHAC